MKFICETEEVFEKVRAALHIIRTNKSAKRSYIEQNCLPPSTLAKVSGLSSTQSKSRQDTLRHACDHRPPGKNIHALHTSLQVPAIGAFIDVIETNEVDSMYLEVAGGLMVKMSNNFVNEHDREKAFFEEIEGLFPTYTLGSESHHQITSGGVLSVELNGNKYKLANFELKNELCGISSEPNVQNMGYYIHFQSKLDTDRAPMLLISVVGCHYLQVFGATWNQGNVCIDPLCTPVSLLYVPRDPLDGITKTARVLAAIDATVKELKQYYLQSEVARKVPNNNWGPYFRTFG